MKSLFHYVSAPGPCGYLHEQTSSLEYEQVGVLSRAEYQDRLLQGWRRFGHVLFRPRCAACSACQSVRVVVDGFRPDRSQRRVRKTNDGAVLLRIGRPSVSPDKLALYDCYHAFQAQAKDWPDHPAKDAPEYVASFVLNPFPTEEWCYYLDDRLVGVGYVDVLPEGLSAIYFFYEPDERRRSLGTWNILSLIDRAARRHLPHVYLGYYVARCRSMEYKARFVPNEILGTAGAWQAFKK